jgi:hypothetical protein
LTPIKKKRNAELTAEEDAFNQLIASVRFIVECSLGRMKIFGVLSSRYRKGSTKLNKHQKIVNICAQITNIAIKREPLSYISTKFLSRTSYEMIGIRILKTNICFASLMIHLILINLKSIILTCSFIGEVFQDVFNSLGDIFSHARTCFKFLSMTVF